MTIIKHVLFLTLIFSSFYSIFPINRERIISYDSKIVINKDGSMTVTENITVYAAGQKIRRGIYRDFPTRYEDKYGNDYNIRFKLLEVLRDGKRESYHTENLSNGIRIYIGRRNYYLPGGEYKYTIKYWTNRQLGYFENFDELYWNVTGNGWDFEIGKVRAVVVLPEGVGTNDVSYLAYTGIQGSKEKNYSARFQDNHSVIFESTKTLGRKEGLTIVVQFPKGFVHEPTFEENLNYFWEDNKPAIIIFAGIIILFLYYLIVWFKVGIDPKKGVIIPEYEPPLNLSPAAVRVVHKMSFDNKAFSAAVVDMCVKGFTSLKEDDGDYKIIKEGDTAVLSKDEKKVAVKLNLDSKNKGYVFEFKQKNHTKIRNAIKSLKKELFKLYEKTFFFLNKTYFFIGVGISLLIVLTAVVNAKGEFGFALLWNSMWGIGVTALVYSAFSKWRIALAGKVKGAALVSAIFLTLFAIPFAIGQIVGLYFLTQTGSLLALVGLILLIVLNIVFHHLLKAPTKLGRKVMDKIEGFKMYLSTAEKDRLNSIKEPAKTPELFEKFLPYAIALDVENEWGEKFNDVLKAAGTEYSPAWYSGTAITTIGAAGIASGLGGSLTATISSSSTAPGSSSGGGGGGFSGGGGGGGGGGGW